MKTYYDLNEYHIKLGKTIIPKKQDHWDYIQFLQELKEGKAELVPYILTWDDIRTKRDLLLKETDWAALPDVNVSTKQSWLVYREMLRNIPQKFKTPEEVVWPEKPNN
jgi:hypothetical protein